MSKQLNEELLDSILKDIKQEFDEVDRDSHNVVFSLLKERDEVKEFKEFCISNKWNVDVPKHIQEREQTLWIDYQKADAVKDSKTKEYVLSRLSGLQRLKEAFDIDY